MTPGTRLVLPRADVLQHVAAEIHELGRPGDVDVLRPAHGDRLEPLVSHHRADAEAAGARPALLDRGEEDPVLAGEPDGGHLRVRLLQLLPDALRGLDGALAVQVGGVADLDLVVVDPQIDQLGRLAANDHLVVAGVFQLRRPEPAHHRVRHQLRLRRIGRDDGAVAAGSRRAAEQAGAEDQQIVFGERFGLGRDPVPQDLGVGRPARRDAARSSLGSVSTLSMLPRERSISRSNPVSAYRIAFPPDSAHAGGTRAFRFW